MIEEIAFLHKAEVFVKTLNVGTTMAPNFGRQDLCAGMANERLKDFVFSVFDTSRSGKKLRVRPITVYNRL